MIRWKYQLTKENWIVCELLFNFVLLADRFHCIILKTIRTSILNVNTANVKRLSGSEKLPELSKKPACEYMPFSLLLAAKGVKRAPLFLQWGARAHFLYSGWWAYSSARASDFFIHFFGAHYTTMTLKLHSATYEFLCQPLSGAFFRKKVKNVFLNLILPQ